jgi:general secretion pathway protein K
VKIDNNRNAARARARGGSVLIAALWVVVLLSLIVSSFAFDMQVESRITSFYRKRLKADYLAQAGVERARMLLVKSLEPGIQDEDNYEDSDAPWYPYSRQLSEGDALHGYSDTLDSGRISVDIVPEPARRNINRLVTNKEDWEKTLKIAGVPEEKWDELTDCLNDWIDPDGKQRVYGAETEDYYMHQDNPPYKAKNLPLDTIGELLLVKGFRRAMVYGGLPEDAVEGEPPMRGMADLLTVFGDDKVNVNAASREVLMTLPGIDDIIANDIIYERTKDEELGANVKKEDSSFKNVGDFFGRFPELQGSLNNRITTGSGTYRITSRGISSGVSRQVSCIATVAKTGDMRVLRWTEGD